MERIRLAFLCFLGVLSVAVCSCRDNEGDLLTVVKGTVTNRVTGEGMEEIPVEIWKCSGGINISGPNCDSAMVTYTNADGAYEMKFVSKKGVYYKTGFGINDKVPILPIDYYGNRVREGEVNEFDYQSIPYQVLQMEITVSKKDKNYLHISIMASDPEGKVGGAFDLLRDTVRANSVIDTIIYRKVLPLSNYIISKTLSNRTGTKPGNYSYEDLEYKDFPAIYKPYADTTIVKVN